MHERGGIVDQDRKGGVARPVCRTGSGIAVLALLALLPAPASAEAAAAPRTGDSAEWDRPGESAVGVLFGGGWYANESFNDSLASYGLAPIENGFEYGLAFRYRIARWVSLGLEISHLDGRSQAPTQSGDPQAVYSIAGTPIVLDVHVHAVRVKGFGLEVFAGAGPLLGGRLRLEDSGGTLDGQSTTFYWHAGGEGEVRFGPSVALFLRFLVRQSEVKDISFEDQLGPGSTATYDIDFNGHAIQFGPRWYFQTRSTP